MLDTLVKKFVGSRNDREVKKIQPLVLKVNELESRTSPLTDQQLQAKTAEFKQRFENGATLDDLLPEAFAVVREAGKRIRDVLESKEVTRENRREETTKKAMNCSRSG